MVEGRASELDFIQLHGDIRDSRKYDTFRGKQAVLFINLLGKGLTQEINGDEAPFDGFLLLPYLKQKNIHFQQNGCRAITMRWF